MLNEMKLRVIRKYQSTSQKVSDMPNEVIINKVLCILAFASMFYSGLLTGEANIKNKILRDCDNGFVEIYNKGIYCSMRTIN